MIGRAAIVGCAKIPPTGNAGMRVIAGGPGYDSFWRSMISVTIEDAAPADVIFTFPYSKPEITKDDISIAGKTLTAGSWAGNVFTVTMSAEAEPEEVLTATFLKGSELTHSITNNLSWNAYWTQRNTLKYSSRTGNTLNETKSSLNAKVLPAVFKGNGSAYYSGAANLLSSDDWVLYLDLEFLAAPGAAMSFLSQGFGPLAFSYALNSNWTFTMTDGTNTRSITILAANLATEARKYSFKITHDKDGTTKIYESGTEKGSATGTFTNTQNGTLFFADKGAGSAWMNDKTALISSRLYSDLAETTQVFSYVFTGENVYDISGNNRNLTSVSVVAANKSYSVNGSTYCLDSGWTLWQKTGSADIRVPSGCTTSPIAAGYAITKAYSGDADGLNMADCLIGFNETGSADTKLEIFDRSNTTRQADGSRSSAYYDSTSLTTKSRYHISEVFPFEALIAFFNTDYQNMIFPDIDKAAANFSVTQINVYSQKAVTTGLTYLKNLYHLDNSYTVGTNNNFRVIQRAINYAYDDCVIIVDEGTFSENLDLTGKRVNLVGSGTLGTIIHYSIESASAVSTVNISKNATFNNLLIDKRELLAGVAKPIVNISGCNVTFTNCQIGRETYVDGYNSQKPMTIANGSVVTMTGSAIKGTKCDGTLPYDLLVTDTSEFNFEGTSFFACLRLQDTARATIDTDILWTNGSNANNPGIVVEDDAEAIITVNTEEKSFNLTTKAEYAAGTYSSSSYRLTGNGYMQLSGNQITGATRVSGAGVQVLFKDIVSTLGHFWCEFLAPAGADTLATFDNCQITSDFNDDTTGAHIIEDAVGGEVRIINNSVLTFSGHSGNWNTMGNPIVSIGKIYIRNSSVIDNVNDNIPYGANYLGTLSCRKIDAEDATLTNQNWDEVGTNTNILITKSGGVPLQIRLKNVVLNNSEINTSPINLNAAATAIEAGDYACINNVTNNTTKDIFSTGSGDAAAAWATLRAACPS